MQRIDATFHEVAFGDERGPRANLPQFVLIAAAVASVGCVSAFALRSRFSPPPPPTVTLAPAVLLADPPGKPEPAPQMSAADFGPMIIEPDWLPAAKAPAEGGTLMNLEASRSSPSSNTTPAEPAVPPTVT